MGEVTEINIVSKNKGLLLSFLNFTSSQIKNNTVKEIVEVMDNWEYENVKTMDTIDEVKAFIDKKIVCITQIGENGQTGVSSEKIDNSLLYNLWFNSTLFENDVEYFKLIENFVRYLSNSKVINDIIIGAIGKETKFEYLGNIKETISKAHNVDVWVIEKSDFCVNIQEEYKILANISCDSIYKQEFVLISSKF